MTGKKKQVLAAAIVCTAAIAAAVLLAVLELRRSKNAPNGAETAVTAGEPSTLSSSQEGQEIDVIQASDEAASAVVTGSDEAQLPEGYYDAPLPDNAETAWTPGLVPTVEEAYSIWDEAIRKAYSERGIYNAIPVINQEPWTGEDGKYYCYVYNSLGTTVLLCSVSPDGSDPQAQVYGSIYHHYEEGNPDSWFLGLMYRMGGDNPDPEHMALLEEKVMAYAKEKFKISEDSIYYPGAFMIDDYDKETGYVKLSNRDGMELEFNISED